SKLKSNKSFFSLIARISTNLCYDHFRYNEVRQRHESLIPRNNDSQTNPPEEKVLSAFLEDEIQKILITVIEQFNIK
ncbi:hypothetical protein N9S34_01270, partial [bacterium]|nr:hypothetical protein [bacterium]